MFFLPIRARAGSYLCYNDELINLLVRSVLIHFFAKLCKEISRAFVYSQNILVLFLISSFVLFVLSSKDTYRGRLEFCHV